jgi:hypothetical protein
MNPGTLLSRLLFGAAIVMALLASIEAFTLIVRLVRTLESGLFR